MPAAPRIAPAVAPRALVVAGAADARRALAGTLRRAGCAIAVAATTDEAIAAIGTGPLDVVLLDPALPDADGASACARLREWTDAPILVVADDASSAAAVRLLDAGADGYVARPFGVDELAARVRALLRRARRAGADRIRHAGVAVDVIADGADVGGTPVALTPTELRLLRELVSARGEIVPARRLVARVWGPAAGREPTILRVQMTRLRGKLDRAGLARGALEAVPGVGYRLRTPPETRP